MAVAYGADAVYLAGTTFGMRAFAGNFDQDELYAGRRATAKPTGCDAHVTINTMPRCSEVKDRLPAWLERAGGCRASTAVIVADLGVLSGWRRSTPPMCRSHISTQASICQLSRLPTPGMTWAPAESFWRGKSLWRTSERFGPKDPAGAGDRSLCPRRYVRVLFRPVPAVQLHDRSGCQPRRLRPALPVSSMYLMEEKRPGEYFPVFEDNEGHLYHQFPGYVHDRPCGGTDGRWPGLPEDRRPG